MSLFEQRTFESPVIVASIIISATLLIGLGVTYAMVRSTDHSASIDVTGYASKEDIVADSAALSISLDGQGASQSEMLKAQTQIQTILTQAGLSIDDINLTSTENSGASTALSADGNNSYSSWTLDVHTKNAVALNKVITSGLIPSKFGAVSVSFRNPEYYVSDISASRNAIIQQAISDAHSRANTVAQSNGVHLGGLRTISGIVVSVVPKGTVSASDYSYGGDDTSSLQKSIIVSVSASYDIDR